MKNINFKTEAEVQEWVNSLGNKRLLKHLKPYEKLMPFELKIAYQDAQKYGMLNSVKQQLIDFLFVHTKGELKKCQKKKVA